MTPSRYDKIILGAGIFGLYAALKCAEKGESVLLLEYDDAPFKRASFINQARVHNGYHYPRSYSTAVKSKEYFERFVHDFDFAMLKTFKKIYATSRQFSYTNANQFNKFCLAAKIPCQPIVPELFFKESMCDGAYETTEYSFDAQLISQYFLKKILAYSNCKIVFDVRLHSLIKKNEMLWELTTNQGIFYTPFLINATYASLNQILVMAQLETFKLKYELCEVALCKVSDNIKDIGLTVMDGSFFSLMPFGKTGYHSLTSVSHTPHMSSSKILPLFSCQKDNLECDTNQLCNCNDCIFRPKTAFPFMYKIAKHYLKDDIEINYQKSLFSMKTILLSSEIDDSRPTIIKFSANHPVCLSIFSGKINTIYDLDEALSCY